MRRLAVGIAIGLVLAGAAVATAAIPDSNGVIHACRDLRTGALRVIDSEAGQSCTNKEAALTWNQAGPQGPPGLSGYEVVVHDEAIPSSTSKVVTAACPAGKHALGGSVAVSLRPPPFTWPDGAWSDLSVAEHLTADSYSALLTSAASTSTARVVVTCATTT
jgi:hypothetical protein